MSHRHPPCKCVVTSFSSSSWPFLSSHLLLHGMKRIPLSDAARSVDVRHSAFSSPAMLPGLSPGGWHLMSQQMMSLKHVHTQPISSSNHQVRTPVPSVFPCIRVQRKTLWLHCWQEASINLGFNNIVLILAAVTATLKQCSMLNRLPTVSYVFQKNKSHRN